MQVCNLVRCYYSIGRAVKCHIVLKLVIQTGEKVIFLRSLEKKNYIYKIKL